MNIKKILLSTLAVSGILLTGCSSEDQPIDTSDELKESSDRVSAADFVEYNILKGTVDFGECEFDISSNTEEVVIYLESDLSVDSLINNLVELNGTDAIEWENNLEELISLTKMIKMELVNNEYSQDCVLRMFANGKIIIEAINGRLKVDEVSESYYEKVEELEKKYDEELYEDMRQTADAKYQIALESEKIFNDLATGNLKGAYVQGNYVVTFGMNIFLKGTAYDYTVEDYQLLEIIAGKITDEFDDYRMSVEFENGGYAEYESGIITIFAQDSSEIWTNCRG
ncbi:MAG: hypothetical protein K2G70_02800 [Turicibacter sp.]|nr:hypothetical protein [Turicibacter sp.]